MADEQIETGQKANTQLSTWSNDMLEGVGSREKIGLLLMELGGHNTSGIISQLDKRRRESATAQAGGPLAEALGHEAAGRHEEAVGSYQNFLRDAKPGTDTSILRQALTGAQRAGKAARGAQTGKTLQDMYQSASAAGGGNVGHDAAVYMALHAISKGEADMNQLGPIVTALKANFTFAQHGEEVWVTRPDRGEPVAKLPITALKAVGSSQVLFKGGKAQSIEADKPEYIKKTPEEEVFQRPGVTLPNQQAPTVPTGTVVPAGMPGQVQPTGADAPSPVIPAGVPRAKITPEEAIGLRGAGVDLTKRGYVDQLSQDEAKVLDTLKRRAPVQAPTRPTPDQIPMLDRMGVKNAGTTDWSTIQARYPNIGTLMESQRQKDEATKREGDYIAQHEAAAKIPYVKAFPTSGRVVFDVKTRQLAPDMSVNDVIAGKGAIVSQQDANSIKHLQGVLPALDRMSKLAERLLSTSGGGANLGKALELAVASKLATSEDLAVFNAMQGTLGLRMAAILNQGRPSDKDAQAVQKGFATTSDSVKTGRAKLREMVREMNESVGALLGQVTTPVGEGDPYQQAINAAAAKLKGAKKP